MEKFWGDSDENVLSYITVMVVQLGKYTKKIDLHTLNH